MKRTIREVLLVRSLSRLIGSSDEFLDLIFELALQWCDLLQHDTQLDQVGHNFGALGGSERLRGELEVEDGEKVVQVGQEEVILQGEERDSGGVGELVGRRKAAKGSCSQRRRSYMRPPQSRGDLARTTETLTDPSSPSHLP